MEDRVGAVMFMVGAWVSDAVVVVVVAKAVVVVVATEVVVEGDD